MATLAETLTKSNIVLDKLRNPAVKEAAKLLIERSYANGVEIRLTAGLRTNSEQQALYNQGRTAAGSIVTNALPGESYHNYSLAIDFVLVNGGYNMQADNDLDGLSDWLEVVAQAKLLGFSWGGDWKSFKDNPHFEMTFGLTIKQLLNGARPTETQINTALAKMKGVDSMDEFKAKLDEQNKVIESLVKRITDIEGTVARLAQLVNVSGNQTPPAWATNALVAAKSKGAITSTNDKSTAEIRIIQMLYNMGLFK